MNEKFERLIERAEALMARIDSVLPWRNAEDPTHRADE